MLRWEKLPYGKRGEFADFRVSYGACSMMRLVVRRLPRVKTWDLVLNGDRLSGHESIDAAKQAAQEFANRHTTQ